MGRNTQRYTRLAWTEITAGQSPMQALHLSMLDGVVAEAMHRG